MHSRPSSWQRRGAPCALVATADVPDRCTEHDLAFANAERQRSLTTRKTRKFSTWLLKTKRARE